LFHDSYLLKIKKAVANATTPKKKRYEITSKSNFSKLYPFA
jgi:hypothetical protein